MGGHERGGPRQAQARRGCGGGGARAMGVAGVGGGGWPGCCLQQADVQPVAPGGLSRTSTRQPTHPPALPSRLPRTSEEKKLKLRSPNFVVSDCRLSVRNIPPSWTEKQLRQAFVDAVRRGGGAVLGMLASWRGLEGVPAIPALPRPAPPCPALPCPAISSIPTSHQPASLPPAFAAPAQVKQRASKARPVVRQAKILVDEERPGPDGAPRSKGIGFVEFSEHEHALCALRQLNNNPKAFSKASSRARAGGRCRG